MKKKIIFLITILSISNLMCGFEAYEFDQDRFTKTEPEPNKMTGNYVLTEKSKEGIFSNNSQDISISLLSDGTFEMHNVPDAWLVTGVQLSNSNDAIFPNKGTWSLVQQDWWWRIEFKFISSNNNPFENLTDGISSRIDISGEKPPYSLWFYVGDRNKGPIMIFEQVMKNP